MRCFTSAILISGWPGIILLSVGVVSARGVPRFTLKVSKIGKHGRRYGSDADFIKQLIRLVVKHHFVNQNVKVIGVIRSAECLVFIRCPQRIALVAEICPGSALGRRLSPVFKARQSSGRVNC